MITIFAFIIMIVLGIIIKKCNNSDVTGGMIFMSGSICLIALVVSIIIIHATANIDIQKNKIEYDGLCKRCEIIKSEYEDMSKSDVINDITAWNIKVYKIKYWTENPWTNWFYSKKVADNLYYIPLEDIESVK